MTGLSVGPTGVSSVTSGAGPAEAGASALRRLSERGRMAAHGGRALDAPAAGGGLAGGFAAGPARAADAQAEEPAPDGLIGGLAGVARGLAGGGAEAAGRPAGSVDGVETFRAVLARIEANAVPRGETTVDVLLSERLTGPSHVATVARGADGSLALSLRVPAVHVPLPPIMRAAAGGVGRAESPERTRSTGRGGVSRERGVAEAAARIESGG